MHLINTTLGAFALLIQISKVAADFHVGYWDGDGGDQVYTEACPSNYYNCDCFQNGDRAGYGPQKDAVADGDNFNIDAGLCGLGELNFYNAGSGEYEFYIAGGDGSVQGTCYTNIATPVNCEYATYSDRLVCYSYVCGSS